MNLYAIKHIPSGKFLSISVCSNGDDAEFCNDTTVQFELGSMYGVFWSTSDYSLAQKVIRESVPWYNSGIEQPMHKFPAGSLEIVTFNMAS